jgi:hypothetical protein
MQAADVRLATGVTGPGAAKAGGKAQKPQETVFSSVISPCFSQSFLDIVGPHLPEGGSCFGQAGSLPQPHRCCL